MGHEKSETARAYCAAIKDRASWFYLLLKNAEEMGIDADELAKRAVTRYGVEKGRKLGEIKNAADFAGALLAGYGCEAFAMEKVIITEKESLLRFHHCALVEAWREWGLAAEEITRLCRLARYGDLGMASNFRGLSLSFPKVLAEGDDCCELLIRYEEK